MITEVQQAIERISQISGQIARAYPRPGLSPAQACRRAAARGSSRKARSTSSLTWIRSGGYNDKVKAYLDAAVRHRKAMLELNTVVGQRIMP